MALKLAEGKNADELEIMLKEAQRHTKPDIWKLVGHIIVIALLLGTFRTFFWGQQQGLMAAGAWMTFLLAAGIFASLLLWLQVKSERVQTICHALKIKRARIGPIASRAP
jgi:hypothetical protein